MADETHRTAIVVAIIGVLGTLSAAVVSNWDKLFGPEISGVVSSADKSSPTGAAQKSVFSEGHLVVHGTWSYDLDLGIQSQDQARADFWWEQKTNVERSLVPLNGALFVIVGIRDFESLQREELPQLSFSSEKIKGDATQFNRLPQGTVIAYRTKQERYGKLVIDSYGYDLAIRWQTFVKK